MSRYSDTVMALGPIGYWRLGEAAGVVAVDEVGLHDGTYFGALAGHGAASLLPSDPANTAFPAAVGTAIVTGVLPPLAAWSLDWWQTGAAVADFGAVLNQSGDQFDVAVMASREIHYFDGIWTPTGVSLAVDETASLAVTFDGADLVLYKNGDVGHTAIGRGSAVTSEAWWLGGWFADGHGPAAGVFDELAIWDRVLTADEVAGIYVAGFASPGFPPRFW